MTNELTSRVQAIHRDVIAQLCSWAVDFCQPGTAGQYDEAGLEAHLKRHLPALAASLAPQPAQGERLTPEWLEAHGFKPKRYQGETVLALSLPKTKLGDAQWIQASELPDLFLICRWSDSYSVTTPPDRVAVNCPDTAALTRLLVALGVWEGQA